MGAGRRSSGFKRKRKSYTKPALQKLTPEEAKRLLQAKSLPGDPQAQKLLREIERIQSKNDKKTPQD